MKRQIVQIDEDKCDGCGVCVPACAEGAIRIEEGKARLESDTFCDGLGACLGECPQDAITIIEREAGEFDEEAVKAHLERKIHQAPIEETSPAAAQPCGCPSAALRQFAPPAPAAETTEPAPGTPGEPSQLQQWPIQIMLVPPSAPFLKNADLLVAADCVPFAYPSFHRDFLAGKNLLVGCPKLDDAQHYVEKFTEIFQQADIRSLTTVIMEVPCCSGLTTILEEAIRRSGKNIPLEKIVIGLQGNRLDDQAPRRMSCH